MSGTAEFKSFLHHYFCYMLVQHADYFSQLTDAFCPQHNMWTLSSYPLLIWFIWEDAFVWIYEKYLQSIILSFWLATHPSKKRACTKMLLPLMLHYPIVCTSTSRNLLRTHLCLWYCRIPTFGRCTAALQYTCLALSMSPTQHYGTTSPRMPRLPSAPVRILVWSFDYQIHPLSPNSLTASTSQEKIP